MSNWWGSPWPSSQERAPVCGDDRERIPTPVGEPCMHCGVEIQVGEQGVSFPGYTDAPDGWQMEMFHTHKACMLRTVLGCSANLEGRGHDHETSYRDDALRVERWVDEHRVR
jgi:hypothetical protein